MKSFQPHELVTWRRFTLLSGACIALVLGFTRVAGIREQHGIAAFLDGKCRGYTPQQAIEWMTDYGDYGRLLYMLQETTLDLFFPLVYGAILAMGIAVALRAIRAPDWTGIAVALPFTGALFDYLENLYVIVMLLRSEDGGSIAPLAQVASRATQVKWGLGVLSFALLALLAAAALLMATLRRTRRESVPA